MRWKGKKCHLVPRTRPSLMPNVISCWEKSFCFLLLFLFHKFYLYELLWSRKCRFNNFNWKSYIAGDDSQTLSWRKVNLSWLKATLHAPRMWDVAQVFLLQRKQGALIVSFHLLRLLGEGKVSQVDVMQNEEEFTHIANNDFY